MSQHKSRGQNNTGGRGAAAGLGALALAVVLGSYGAYHLGQQFSGVSKETVTSTDVGGAAGAGGSVDGSALFASNCAGCHGAKAEGAVGPALAPTKAWTLPQFKEAVLHGKAPQGDLKSMMPHFGDTGFDGQPASDAQVEALHNFIKTL